MILTVKDVDYLGDYTLLCTFNDGVTKKVDLQPLLKYPASPLIISDTQSQR